MSESTYRITIPTDAAMQNLGNALSRCCPNGSILYLQGDLGAGKTTLTRGFLRGLGYSGNVKSPTYTLVEPYQLGQTSLFHFDLYRLTDPEELELIGIRDYTVANAICIFEWLERGKSCLPAADLICMIAHQLEQRSVTLIANSEIGTGILRQLHDEDL